MIFEFISFQVIFCDLNIFHYFLKNIFLHSSLKYRVEKIILGMFIISLSEVLWVKHPWVNVPFCHAVSQSCLGLKGRAKMVCCLPLAFEPWKHLSSSCFRIMWPKNFFCQPSIVWSRMHFVELAEELSCLFPA